MPHRLLQINKDRLLNDLRALTQIGATAEGGVHRPALSEADLSGREWFRRSIQAAGLELREDGAGNISACSALGGTISANAPTRLAFGYGAEWRPF